MRGAKTSAPSTVKSYGKRRRRGLAIVPRQRARAQRDDAGGCDGDTPRDPPGPAPPRARGSPRLWPRATGARASIARRPVSRRWPRPRRGKRPDGVGQVGDGAAAAEARSRAVRSVFSNLAAARAAGPRPPRARGSRTSVSSFVSSPHPRAGEAWRRSPPVSWSCGRNRAHRSRCSFFLSRRGGHIVGAAEGTRGDGGRASRTTAESHPPPSPSRPSGPSRPSRRESRESSDLREPIGSLSRSASRKEDSAPPPRTRARRARRRANRRRPAGAERPRLSPRRSRTSSKRSPPGPSSTAATTASSSSGFRLHVEYSRNPPGRTPPPSSARQPPAWRAARCPAPGCHRFKTSGYLAERAVAKSTARPPARRRIARVGRMMDGDRGFVRERGRAGSPAPWRRSPPSRPSRRRRGAGGPAPRASRPRAAGCPVVRHDQAGGRLRDSSAAAAWSCFRAPRTRPARGRRRAGGGKAPARGASRPPPPGADAGADAARPAAATSGCSFLWWPARSASAAASTARQPSPGGIHGMGSIRPFACRGARKRAVNARASGRETCTRNVMGKDVAKTARVSANSRGGASLCAR